MRQHDFHELIEEKCTHCQFWFRNKESLDYHHKFEDCSDYPGINEDLPRLDEVCDMNKMKSGKCLVILSESI